MRKAKSILSVILLASVLASVAAGSTRAVLMLPLWIAVPLCVVVWSAVVLAGVYAYERGR